MKYNGKIIQQDKFICYNNIAVNFNAMFYISHFCFFNLCTELVNLDSQKLRTVMKNLLLKFFIENSVI